MGKIRLVVSIWSQFLTEKKIYRAVKLPSVPMR